MPGKDSSQIPIGTFPVIPGDTERLHLGQRERFPEIKQ